MTQGRPPGDRTMEPRSGAIAYCKHGWLGVLTHYERGVWMGFHLDPAVIAKCWQSRRPRVIGYTEDLDLGMRLMKVIHEHGSRS